MKCIDQVVIEGRICKATFDSKFDQEKEFNIFTCDDESAEKIEQIIHLGVLNQIQKAILKLGDDTPELLDYVYFDTEPMANAKKGDLLDFSKAKRIDPIKKVKLKKLSPETIKLAREKIKQLSDEMQAERKRLIQDEQGTEKYKDDAYYKFIDMLDGEELAIGLKGIAKIQIAE